MRRAWRGRSRLGIAGLAFLLFGREAVAQEAVPIEYQVKAVFLYNFTRFVEWPPRAFADPHTPFVIGILGDDPFGSFLDKAVRGETACSRPVVIRRYQRIEEITDCQVLFISRSETDKLERILGGLKGRTILSVGDTDRFSQSGGMIQLATENGKIRLKINVKRAKAAELAISSKLLRSAKIVVSGGS